jgi:hypothetical protein
MDSSIVQALVNYYLRQGFDNSVTDATGILLQRDSNNSFLRFWHAFGLYISGEATQARSNDHVSARLKYFWIGMYSYLLSLTAFGCGIG